MAERLPPSSNDPPPGQTTPGSGRASSDQDQILQSAQRMESLGIFSAGIAHDLNNLLTGIFGYMTLAKESIPEESDAARNLDNAISTFNSARALTRRFLTHSKPGVSSKTTISLSSLIRECAQLALSGSNVSFELRLPDDLWNCDADKYQIEQVFDNILINARHSMPDGGKIAISARNVPSTAPLPPPLPPRPYVSISITDQGIGIPNDILPRIFDPFFTTKQQGNGLGLSTAHSIIAKHSGHILVHSESHKGTTFSIFLPASQASFPIEPRPPLQPPHHRNAKILFVDDMDFLRDISQSILSPLGYSVIAVANSAAAIDLYRKAFLDQQPFDLVILDLIIPGSMNAIQTIHALSEIDPTVNAIVSSGYANDPVLVEPHKYGFKGKLEKPYLTQDLLLAVERALTPPPPVCQGAVPNSKELAFVNNVFLFVYIVFLGVSPLLVFAFPFFRFPAGFRIGRAPPTTSPPSPYFLLASFQPA